jgi:hypothetical protein
MIGTACKVYQTRGDKGGQRCHCLEAETQFQMTQAHFLFHLQVMIEIQEEMRVSTGRFKVFSLS